MSLKDTLVDIFHERTNFRFIAHRRQWFALSAVLILIGIASFGVRGGLNLGIEFKGGTQWQVDIVKGKSVSVSSVRDKLKALGVPNAQVAVTKEIGTGKRTIRVQGPVLKKSGAEDTGKEDKVSSMLAGVAGAKDANRDVNRSSVSATWGSEVSSKAIKALIAFFIVIVIYLSLRFELKMAVSAVIAVVHDILIAVGVYAVTNLEVTPATVVAFLTILGYSLYDTVVVFDKVDENVSGLAMTGRDTYSDIVDKSMNEVLMRSLNTSIVALLPVFSLLVVGAYIFGATTTRDFALALFVGLLSGAYSSIFVASPILAWWKEREPRYAALRARIQAKQGTAAAPAVNVARAATPASAGRRSGGSDDDDGVGEPEADDAGSEPVGVRMGPAVTPRPQSNRPGQPPRPRKKKRRR
jgi:preprotein translocase subunit SecF